MSSDNRQFKRAELLSVVTLRLGDRRIELATRDLSLGGMAFDLDDDLGAIVPGARCEVVLPDLAVAEAEILSAENGRVRLRFTDEALPLVGDFLRTSFGMI